MKRAYSHNDHIRIWFSLR